MTDIVSPEQRAAIQAMLDDPHNWLSPEEAELFQKSGLDTAEEWVEKVYGLSGAAFISWKKTDLARKSSPPPSRPKPPPPPSKSPPDKKGGDKTSHGLRLLAQYTTATPSGKKITITKLSRQFIGDEEDLHRCKMCDDHEVMECIDFAIKKNLDCFSCANCPHFKTLA